MNSKDITRRQFIKKTAVASGAAILATSTSGISGTSPSASDMVPLGGTGLKITRIGFGTGTMGGTVQRELTTKEFNNLMHYAYEKGIRYIDTAENYKTHTWVHDAIKGLPREKLFILTKMPRIPENPMETLDRYRKELGVEYLDAVLVHAVGTPNWDEERKKVLDALELAKSKEIIRSHGVSCHSLTALRTAAKLDWVDVNLVRINPQGVLMDILNPARGKSSDESHVPDVVKELQIMRKNNHGIIGMKIYGEGRFLSFEDRQRSMNYIWQSGLVDSITIGFKSEKEIDETINLANQALKG